MNPLNCSNCAAVFDTLQQLQEHTKLHCNVCHTLFLTTENLNQHMKTHVSSVLHRHCEACNENMRLSFWTAHLRSKKHRDNSQIMKINDELVRRRSDFQARIETYSFINKNEDILLPGEFFRNAKSSIEVQLGECSRKLTTFKFNMELICDYIKMVNDDMSVCTITHMSKMMLVTISEDLSLIYAKHADEICKKLDEFQERDSGWTLLTIRFLDFNINKATIIKGSSYIPLPSSIAYKRACINVVNTDDYCFKWSLIAALYQDDRLTFAERKLCESYNVINISSDKIVLNDIELNFEGLKFPLPLQQIKEFEKQNSISVNVFGLDESFSIEGPYYITQGEKESHINLLLLQSNGNFHYVYIKDISKLLRSSITLHRERVYICNTCLQHTHDSDLHETHRDICGKEVMKMPASGATVSFTNLHRQLEVPFVIYADFESILEKVEDEVSTNTTNVQKHNACAFSYYVNCSFDKKNNLHRYYFGEDSGIIFIKKVMEDAKSIFEQYLNIDREMEESAEDVVAFNNALVCHICKENLNNDRVRDHCHITGKYRGAAHKECNLKYKKAKFIPVIFHNLSAYDMHLFFIELSSIKNVSIKIIPQTKERYISLSVYVRLDKSEGFEVRFLDSFRFMASSLETLAKNVDIENFHTVRSFSGNENRFNLIRRKGVYPYSYMDSMTRFEETKLPAREEFFNILSNEECSIEDYKHAQRVWNEFGCKTLLDYAELYLKSDVLLLTDIFENFRKICKSIYDLDPCHYYTSPGLSWDAMLKTTQVKLELLTDSDMYRFMQNGIRGGLVQCSKRYAKANNKYLKDFDITKQSEYLIYLDANNLYGWAMSEYLPCSQFEWMYKQDLDVEKISDTSDYGYILEVDIDYPDCIHDAHNDLPFCPQNKMFGASKSKKLIADLLPKKRYIIHYRVLKQCISNGLILRHIHRILKFKQSAWLKKYIDLNTLHRTKAKNNFEKDFFKLMNNAVYGKTMENIDKRRDIRIVTTWETTNKKKLGLRALISMPNFMNLTKFSDDLYAVELKKMQPLYNKPIYVGFSVLELSKWKMYDFHYRYMKPKFGDNLSLNYMDTDSFIYTIKTDDFYSDIRSDISLNFDTSEYPEDNQFHLPLLNKKVLGMMKDENKGDIMTEFVGLRSKMYAFSTLNSEEVKKCKGVKMSVIKKRTLNDYKSCLFERKNVTDEMFVIRPNFHQLYTQKLSKVVLSHSDDKRNIMSDNVNSRPWGHYADREDIPMDVD